MTRGQKAVAAYGSVIVVGLIFLRGWSVPGGLLWLALGLAAVTGVLRATNTRTRRPPAHAAPRRPSSARAASSDPLRRGQQEQRAQRAELQRRREVATARALERQQRSS